MNHIQVKKAYNELLNILYVLENQNLLMSDDQLIQATGYTMDAVADYIIKNMEWDATNEEVLDVIADGICERKTFEEIVKGVNELSEGKQW